MGKVTETRIFTREHVNVHVAFRFKRRLQARTCIAYARARTSLSKEPWRTMTLYAVAGRLSRWRNAITTDDDDCSGN